MKKKHAKYGGSTAERWLNCPGSVNLSEGMPEQAESEAAREGTRAHECLEALLKNPHKQLSVAAELRTKYPLQMVVYAESAFKEIMSAKPKNTPALPEQKVKLDFLHPDAGGTVDVTIAEEFGALTIADYKYGYHPVEVARNAQLIFYALGIAHQYDYNFEEVRLQILQPRAEHEDGPYREFRMSMDALFHWREDFRLAIEQAEGPDAPLKSGKWCRYCPAAPTCRVLSEETLKEAQLDFGDVILGKPLALSDPKSVEDPKRLEQLLNAFPKLETWMSAVRGYAYGEMDRGRKIPGWKLVEKRARRQWLDAATTGLEAELEVGDDAFKRELLSPRQLERLTSKEWVAKRCASVSSGKRLAPQNDLRGSISTLDEDFLDEPLDGEPEAF